MLQLAWRQGEVRRWPGKGQEDPASVQGPGIGGTQQHGSSNSKALANSVVEWLVSTREVNSSKRASLTQSGNATHRVREAVGGLKV